VDHLLNAWLIEELTCAHRGAKITEHRTLEHFVGQRTGASAVDPAGRSGDDQPAGDQHRQRSLRCTPLPAAEHADLGRSN
jgi:hypothetical protein